MTNAIVIYDSTYGNTAKVAKALAQGLTEQQVNVDCVRFDKVDIAQLKGYDLLAIGGPTQYGTVSAPLKTFIEGLSKAGLQGKKGFAFDTRYDDPQAGSAAEAIETNMRGLKLSMVRSRASAIVLGGEGPLQRGSEETFRRIGSELAKLVL